MNMYDAERTRVTASSPWLRIHEFITAEPTTPCRRSLCRLPCEDTRAPLPRYFQGKRVACNRRTVFRAQFFRKDSFEIEHFHKLGGRIISGEIDQFHRLTFQIRWNRRKMIGFSSRREINSDYEIDPKARI